MKELFVLLGLFLLGITLWWEHDTMFTSMFVIERTTDFSTWQIVGFVSPNNKYATNATDYTFRWHSDSEPFGFSLYRVGALPENQEP